MYQPLIPIVKNLVRSIMLWAALALLLSVCKTESNTLDHRVQDPHPGSPKKAATPAADQSIPLAAPRISNVELASRGGVTVADVALETNAPVEQNDADRLKALDGLATSGDTRPVATPKVDLDEAQMKFAKNLLDPFVVKFSACSSVPNDASPLCVQGTTNTSSIHIPLMAPRLDVTTEVCRLTYGPSQVESECSETRSYPIEQEPSELDEDQQRTLTLLRSELNTASRVKAYADELRYELRDIVEARRRCGDKADELKKMDEFLKLSPRSVAELFFMLKVEDLVKGEKDPGALLQFAVVEEEGNGGKKGELEKVFNAEGSSWQMITLEVGIIAASLFYAATGINEVRWSWIYHRAVQHRRTVMFGDVGVSMVPHKGTGNLVEPVYEKIPYDKLKAIEAAWGERGAETVEETRPTGDAETRFTQRMRDLNIGLSDKQIASFQRRPYFYVEDPKTKYILYDNLAPKGVSGKPVYFDYRAHGLRTNRGRIYLLEPDGKYASALDNWRNRVDGLTEFDMRGTRLSGKRVEVYLQRQFDPNTGHLGRVVLPPGYGGRPSVENPRLSADAFLKQHIWSEAGYRAKHLELWRRNPSLPDPKKSPLGFDPHSATPYEQIKYHEWVEDPVFRGALERYASVSAYSKVGTSLLKVALAIGVIVAISRELNLAEGSPCADELTGLSQKFTKTLRKLKAQRLLLYAIQANLATSM